MSRVGGGGDVKFRMRKSDSSGHCAHLQKTSKSVRRLKDTKTSFAVQFADLWGFEWSRRWFECSLQTSGTFPDAVDKEEPNGFFTSPPGWLLQRCCESTNRSRTTVNCSRISGQERCSYSEKEPRVSFNAFQFFTPHFPHLISSCRTWKDPKELLSLTWQVWAGSDQMGIVKNGARGTQSKIQDFVLMLPWCHVGSSILFSGDLRAAWYLEKVSLLLALCGNVSTSDVGGQKNRSDKL